MQISLKSQVKKMEAIKNGDNRFYIANSVFEVVEDYFGEPPGEITRKKRAGDCSRTHCRPAAVYILSHLGFSQMEIAKIIKMHYASVSKDLCLHYELVQERKSYKAAVKSIIELLPNIDL